MKYSHLSETVSVTKVSEENNVGVFTVEGLYPGYGVTVGNSLRRALLSSLPGAAITQIKIKGVDHEFSTIPGMQEDVVEFTLNLKKVRFHFFADEPQVLRLHVKGGEEVKAGRIESTALVRVENAELEMELTVEKGRGYSPAETRYTERLPIGAIVLDAIFSPIRNVEFSVENMRVGDRTDFNRLKLKIETDGSISPSGAFHKAGNVLKDHFEKVSGIEVLKVELESQAEKKKTKKKK